jgi:hypothetical protein
MVAFTACAAFSTLYVRRLLLLLLHCCGLIDTTSAMMQQLHSFLLQDVVFV